jgi:hypothetical protein
MNLLVQLLTYFRRTFEHKANDFIYGLICDRLKIPNHDGYHTQISINNILTCPSYNPCNYISLHKHVAKRHPPLLESFEQGWNNLLPHL